MSHSLEALESSGPEFISVTFGAQGSSRDSSLGVLRRLHERGHAPAMAHLTCVGSSYSEASALIREFLDAGITSFLALRGDPPGGSPAASSVTGDLGSAAELVQLIHRVQSEREPFRLNGVPGFPDARRVTSGKPVTIAVAAFPHGHPHSRSVSQDLDTLLAKEAAGANLAITQVFFESDDFLGFVALARSAGVTLRMLPGIMPVMSVRRLERVLELTNAPDPLQLRRELANADDTVAAASTGIDYTTRLCREVLSGGATGLHLYTFNQHEPVLAVLEGAGLIGSTPRRHSLQQEEPA